MSCSRSLLSILAALSCIFTCPPAFSDSIQFTSADRGWYGRSGFHNATDANYQVGADDGYRSFFVFDLSGVTANITAARLELTNYASSASGHAPFSLHDVHTPVSTLTAPHLADQAIFDDLGSGQIYGQVNDAADVPTVTIELNSDFLANLNSRQSDLIALGGRLDNSQNAYAYAFAGTGGNSATPRLILETGPANADAPAAPLPSVVLLGSVLMGGLTAARRSRA